VKNSQSPLLLYVLRNTYMNVKVPIYQRPTYTFVLRKPKYIIYNKCVWVCVQMRARTYCVRVVVKYITPARNARVFPRV